MALSVYKKPQPKKYNTGQYYVEDTSASSPLYFNLVTFPPRIGGGRSLIVLKGNGDNLRLNSTIDVEMIDASGKNMYVDFTSYIDRFNNYYLTIEVYDITAKGLATVYLVGEALVDLQGNPIPKEFQGKYNVRWSGQIEVLPFERNNADLQFDKAPHISVAQIAVPAKIQNQTTGSGGYIYSSVTSSRAQHTIDTSFFQGYDRDFSTSNEIRDPRLQQILINAKQVSATANSVNTAQREVDIDIENGFKLNLTSRFGTIVTSTSSFFRKEFLGGVYSFYDPTTTGPTTSSLQPVIPSQSYTISGSLADQLITYGGNIVEVVNDTQIVIDKPVTIKAIPLNAINKNATTAFTYKKVQPQFTASITYGASNSTFSTSTTVTQSYLEFTFSDLNPISGDVYRIKTFTKLQSLTGEYKLLNDQIVTPPEYLTDPTYPNITAYGKSESDYLLIGHFTSGSFNIGDIGTPISILENYWDAVVETPSDGFSPTTPLWNSSELIESVKLLANYTQSRCFTTKTYQNYSTDQRYTLGFYCVLDPYTELEIYMGSDPLNLNVTPPTVFTRAFNKTENAERTRTSEVRSRFGKYIGKIVNNRSVRKYYGKLLFDFETDGSGLGRPVFRSRVVDETLGTSGSAYISEVSIKPYQLNGFTPKLVQFPVPLNAELVDALEVSQSIDFKIEYFDYTGRQSEYVTYLDDIVVNVKTEVAGIGCQTEVFQNAGFWSGINEIRNYPYFLGDGYY